MAHNWYAIQTHSGSELTVKRALESLSQDMADDRIQDVLVPTEDLIEVKKGWIEAANLWIAIVGGAGVGKTPSISNITFPLQRLNMREIKRYVVEFEKYINYHELPFWDIDHAWYLAAWTLNMESWKNYKRKYGYQDIGEFSYSGYEFPNTESSQSARESYFEDIKKSINYNHPIAFLNNLTCKGTRKSAP